MTRANLLKLGPEVFSDGSPGWGCSEVVGSVTSSLSVHAWSLVAMVGSVMIATIVVVVLLPLASFCGCLSQGSCRRVV